MQGELVEGVMFSYVHGEDVWGLGRDFISRGNIKTSGYIFLTTWIIIFFYDGIIRAKLTSSFISRQVLHLKDFIFTRE